MEFRICIRGNRHVKGARTFEDNTSAPPNMELSIVLTTFAKEDFLCFRISFRKIEGFFSC
jgi:hypothetical protein